MAKELTLTERLLYQMQEALHQRASEYFELRRCDVPPDEWVDYFTRLGELHRTINNYTSVPAIMKGMLEGELEVIALFEEDAVKFIQESFNKLPD